MLQANRPCIVRTAIRAALLSMIGAGQVVGQSRVSPGIAAQVVAQDGPLGGQAGPGAVLTASLTSPNWLGATLALDAARLRHGDRISLCIPVPGGGCLDRPDVETIIGLALSVEAQLGTGQRLRPFFGVGPALRFASGPDQPGEARSWFTPSLETGLRLTAGNAQWAVSLRWRRVDRWEAVKPVSELGILVGVRRGKRF